MAAEHEVHRTPDLVREKGDRLALAVLLGLALDELLGLGAAAHHRDRCLRERPLEVGIAPLAPTTSDDLPVGLDDHRTHIAGSGIYGQDFFRHLESIPPG